MSSKEDKCAIAKKHLAVGEEVLSLALESGASTKKAESIIKQAKRDIEKWCLSDKTNDLSG